ncbi:MAG: hypothetical protein GX595_06535, partial [Lentisphaerae bacterium]|nr:hypothetical protein [Lentisphaerota bacterium]
ATTWQIAEATGSLAVHSDVTSLRCLCEAEGIVTADAAVSCRYAGQNDDGRHIHRYVLHPLVIRAVRDGRLSWEDLPDRHARPPQPQPRRSGPAHQGRLFDVARPHNNRPPIGHGRKS